MGSLVRLQSGLLGVVCAPHENSMSTPQVAAFYHIGLQRMLRPAKLLDLEKLPNERIVAGEDPSKWPFTNLEHLWQKAAATATRLKRPSILRAAQTAGLLHAA